MAVIQGEASALNTPDLSKGHLHSKSCLTRQCLPLALKGPSTYACQCLLIGHEQTCRGPALTAEFDPWLCENAALDVIRAI